MKNRDLLEELIADEMTIILERAVTLDSKDKEAIVQEYREWLNGISKSEDIWVIDKIKPKQEEI
tara:strand:+ start:372 stop:563 length:192 start_codon:yes stop_codon:yes gene_type:complete